MATRSGIDTAVLNRLDDDHVFIGSAVDLDFDSDDVLEKWKESIPLKRSGKPNDVGNACVFLASDLSSYITGQVLQVDGGLLT